MSRFQDDKFQSKNEKNNVNNSSRFSDVAISNSTQTLNKNSDSNSKLIVSDSNSTTLILPNKTNSNSKLISNEGKGGLSNTISHQTNNLSSSSSKKINNNSNSTQTLNKNSDSNSKLIVSDSNSTALILPNKTNSNSKLVFDKSKDTFKINDKVKDISFNDMTNDTFTPTKQKTKLIFRISEEKGENGKTVNFNLAENKRFATKKHTKVKLDRNTTIYMTDKDVTSLKKQLKESKRDYKSTKKQLHSQSNNVVGSSRLYEHDNSSKLSITSTNKIDLSSRLKTSEKSQLAIKLYSKHNTKKNNEPYDIQQLKKYNLNFNIRNYNFVFIRKNFSTSSTRDNFMNYVVRENFNLQPQTKKLELEQKKLKLKIEKKVVKKANKAQSSKNRKAHFKRFLKKQYANAFRQGMKSFSKNDEDSSDEPIEDIRAMGRGAGSFYRGIKAVTKVFVKVFKVVWNLLSSLLSSLTLPVIGWILVIFLILGGASIVFIQIQSMLYLVFGEVSLEHYDSENEDILETEAQFEVLEDDLKEIIGNIKNDYPNFDYYDFTGINTGSIAHDPHELAAYLTALLGSYTKDTAQEELEKLIDLMYELEFEEIDGEKFVPTLDAEGNPMYDAEGNPVGTTTPTVTLKVTLNTKTLKEVAKEVLTNDQYERFELLLETKGHADDLFEIDSISNAVNTLSTMSVNTSDNPSIVTSHHMITNPQFAKTVKFGEQFIGMKYVFGGSTPETGFDCSGFISYIFNQTGVASFPRTTAQGLYNMSTHIPNGQQQAGDLVFFQGTYDTPNTVTHVGYYVGNGIMLHCGNPIGYVDINSSAYAKSFYAFGRIE